MKKNLLYMAMAISFAAVMTACGSDSDDTPNTPPIAPEPLEAQAMDMTVLDDNSVSLAHIFLTKPGKTFYSDLSKLPTRASGSSEFSEGSYSFNNGTYQLKDNLGNPICAFIITAPDMADFTFPNKETIKRKVRIAPMKYTDAKSNTLCHNWKIAAARLRHYDGVTAVKQFDNPAEAASLNAILNYAKTKASIDETFEEGMTVKNIVFTPSGKFIIFFGNNKSFSGDWSWTSTADGKLKYSWDNYETMHNEFEDGTAVFDVRAYKKTNYFALTFGSTIKPKNGNSYKIELTFYLEQSL